jgi:uncharacterized protein (UPF0128 family)
LKNGYYIFAYIEINKFANYYKTDTKRHDQNLSLWKYNNGNLSLVRYWELERLSRIDKKSLFRGTDTRPPACACPHADRLEPV